MPLMRICTRWLVGRPSAVRVATQVPPLATMVGVLPVSGPRSSTRWYMLRGPPASRPGVLPRTQVLPQPWPVWKEPEGRSAALGVLAAVRQLSRRTDCG